MYRLLEFETRQPATMQFGPGWPAVMVSLAQQKPAELLACSAYRMHPIERSTPTLAYRFVPATGNPACRQLARPMQPRQTGCIPPIRLDPVARSSWDQRGSNDDTFMAALRHV